MRRFLCEGCQYVYDPDRGDPEHGVEPDTDFYDLPKEWVCPVCGLGAESFSELE